MAKRSQPHGQALVEILFFILMALSYCLIAQKMTAKWTQKLIIIDFMTMGNLNELLGTYKEHKGWVILGALLVISSISSQFYNNSDPDKTENPPEDVSTFIPKGYRLVPLPIENYKNLDQILGNYGVVDLYVKTLINSKVHTELLGSGIRALRAKNGSESIGLLVPLEQVKTLLKKDGKFYLTINNSNSSGTVFEESKIRISKSRVSFAN